MLDSTGERKAGEREGVEQRGSTFKGEKPGRKLLLNAVKVLIYMSIQQKHTSRAAISMSYHHYLSPVDSMF